MASQSRRVCRCFDLISINVKRAFTLDGRYEKQITTQPLTPHYVTLQECPILRLQYRVELQPS